MRRMGGLWSYGCVALALAATPALAARIEVGKPAPDFHATSFDGKHLSLADYKGQVLVVNIWATWCGPCRRELPLLDSYHRIQGKFGLSVLAMTTEDSVPTSWLKPLAGKASITMAKSLRGPYQDVEALPTNYVIDRAGIVRYAKAEAFDLNALNAVLVPLLKEPAPVEAAAVTAKTTDVKPAPAK